MLTIGLVLEGEPVLFNHRVGQDFPRNPFHFRLRIILVQTLQRDLKKFALPHTLQTFITHFFQRALDGFALRIENALFKRDVDVSLHAFQLYVTGKLCPVTLAGCWLCRLHLET